MVAMTAAGIEAFQFVGAEHVIISLNTGDVANLKRQMEVIAGDEIPQFN